VRYHFRRVQLTALYRDALLTTQTQRRGGAEAQRAPQALLPPRTTSPDDFFFVTAAREATRSSPSGCSQENPGSWREVLYVTTEPLCVSAPLRLCA